MSAPDKKPDPIPPYVPRGMGEDELKEYEKDLKQREDDDRYERNEMERDLGISGEFF